MTPSDNSSKADPCGSFGPVQKKAVLWSVCAIIAGTIFCARFMGLDRWMYDNDADILDYTAYDENRTAQTELGSERLDSRQAGGLSDAVKRLETK